MAVISDVAIRELAGFRAEGSPVTTCYLDVDGRRFRRHQDYELELDALLRAARAKAEGKPSVIDDLRRIETFVKAGIDRSHIRGLAMFACSAQDLWKVVALPVPVRNQVVVNAVPAVGQLEAVLADQGRIGVLLADRQVARMFVFELGELVERSELFEALPRDYDARGEKERGDTSHHVEALAHQHLKHAAQVAFQVFQEQPFDHLAIGAADEVAHEIEAELHQYLKQRLAGRVHVVPSASIDAVRNAVIDLEQRLQRERESALVERLRDEVGADRRGVAGLEGVLQALVERRVERLLVSQGFSEHGWRCEACGRLCTVCAPGRRCPVCGGSTVEVPDIVEEAVEEALAQSCAVTVCQANADLDVLGRIGAVLRY